MDYSDIIYISEELGKDVYKRQQRILMTKKLRDLIKRRDNFTCCNCGNSTYAEPNLLLEIDHIIPVAKGGRTVEENLQTLCWKCNKMCIRDSLLTVCAHKSLQLSQRILHTSSKSIRGRLMSYFSECAKMCIRDRKYTHRTNFVYARRISPLQGASRR